jgi:hypothetical protein
VQEVSQNQLPESVQVQEVIQEAVQLQTMNVAQEAIDAYKTSFELQHQKALAVLNTERKKALDDVTKEFIEQISNK